jgi:hypothetical protein
MFSYIHMSCSAVGSMFSSSIEVRLRRDDAATLWQAVQERPLPRRKRENIAVALFNSLLGSFF